MSKNRVQIEIGYTINKSGLETLQSQLQNIIYQANQPGKQLDRGLQNAAKTAKTLDEILDKTFNKELGSLNVSKFTKELSKAGMSLSTVKSSLEKDLGSSKVFYNLESQILGTNLQLKQSNKLLDDMAASMANTVKWGITSSIFNTITDSISKAVHYTEKLNSSLTDIRIVTGKSSEDMAEYAVEANKAAKALKVNTLDYTNASLIYYQQGLSEEEVRARTETTAKAANVTKQTGDAVSEQLTAVWNGYQVTAEHTEEYVDKLAAVATETASDLKELSIGMSKVASGAKAMGVDVDQLNAQLATIISVTRQAPESVGTALKTIYARLGDLKVDGVDEFGVTLGEVSGTLDKVGIKILNEQGNLRSMGNVIGEVASKWDTWTEAQRQAIAVAMAGKRQYNNLIALFDNWDMYTDALNTSKNALGTLQEQQDIYIESTEAKLKKLKATWQDLYAGLIDSNEVNTAVEGLTNIVQVFDNFIDSFGGGASAITSFGVIFSSVFDEQISKALIQAKHNQDVYRQNLELLENKIKIVKEKNNNVENKTNMSSEDRYYLTMLETQKEFAEKIQKVKQGLTTESYNELTAHQQEIGAVTADLDRLQNKIDKFKNDSKNKHLFNEVFKDLSDKSFSSEYETKYAEYFAEVEEQIGKDKQSEEAKRLKSENRRVKDYINSLREVENLTTQELLLREEIEDKLKESNQIIQTENKISAITNAASSITTSWGAISSIYQTLNDENTTALDKTQQIFGTLAISMPVLFSNVKKLKNALYDENNGLFQFTEINKMISGDRKFNATDLFSNTGKDTLQLLLDKTQKDLKNTNLSDKERNDLLSRQTEITNKLNLASQIRKGLLLSLPAILLTIASAIDTISHKIAQTNIDSLTTDIEKLKVESEQLADTSVLEDKYEKAKKSYQENTGSKKDMILAARELTKAYGIEGQAVFALTEQYGALEQAIIAAKQAQTSSLEDNYRQLKQDVGERAGYKKQAESHWYDFSDVNSLESNVTAYKDSLGYQVLKNNNVFNTEGTKIALDDLKQTYEGLLQAREDLKSFSNVANEKELVDKLLKLYKDDYEILKQSAINTATAKATELVNNTSVSNQKGFNSEYELNKKQLIQNYSLTEEEANSILQEAYSANEKYNDYLKNYTYSFGIAKSLQKQTKEDLNIILDEVTAALKNWSDSDKAFLYIHPELVSSIDQLQNTDFQNRITDINSGYFQPKQSYNIVTNALKTNNISTDDISALFQSGLGDFSNMSEYEFSNLDMSEKLNVLDQYKPALEKLIKSNVESTQKALTEAEKEINTQIVDFVNDAQQNYGFNQDTLRSFEDAIDASDLKDKYSDFQKEAEKYLDLEPDKKSFSTFGKDLQETLSLSEKDLDNFMNVIIDYNNLIKQENVFQTLAADAENFEEIETVTAESVSARKAMLSKEVDNLQSAYKTLKDATLEYNSTNSLTIDTLQALLELDSKYLDALTFENNQLIFNEEVIKSLTQTKMEEMKQIALKEYFLNLTDIAVKNNIISEQAAAEAAKNLGIEYSNTAVEAENLKNKVAELNQQLFQSGNPAAVEQAKKAQEDYEKRLALIGTFQNNTNFSSAMNYKAPKSSGGGSKKKDKEQLEYKKEFDRYHDLKIAIDKLTNSLRNLNKEQSHLSGGALIDSLKIENSLIEKQTKKYKELLEAQKQEASELQGILKAHNVVFASDGTIENYAKATVEALQKYDNAIEKYNKGLIDEATLKIHEQNYKEFKETLKRYDELINKEIVDTQNKIKDAAIEIKENNLKAWETELKLKLDLSEAKRQWSDFVTEVNEDFKATYRDLNKIFDNLNFKANSLSQDTVQDEIGAIEEIVQEIQNMNNGQESDMFVNMSEAQEKLKELRDSLMDDAKALHDLWKQAWEAYMEGIEQAASKLDDLMAKFNRIDDELIYRKDLTELLYGTEAYELIDKIYDAQTKNNLVQIDSLRQQRDMWKSLYDAAEEGSEEQTKYYDLWNQAQQDLNNKVVEYIQLLKNDYVNTINSILKTLDKNVTGGTGIDKVREQWERAKKESDKYYDNVEKILELEKLESKWQNAIDTAPSLKAQEELKKMMDSQLKDLKDKNKLTEYDILLSEKKLAVAQAEIALQEAQSNKSALKVVRDTSGNWNYQYVTDEEDILNKKEELTNAYNDLYDLVKRTQEEALNNIITIHEEYLQKIKEIAMDETLTQEEKLAKQKEVTEIYLQDLAIAQDEAARYEQDLNQVTMETLWGLYMQDKDNYQQMTDAEKALIDELKNHNLDSYAEVEEFVKNSYDQIKDKCEQVTNDNLVTWDTAAKDMADMWNSDDGASVKSMVLEALDKMQSATIDFNNKVDEASKAAQDDFYDVEGAIKKAEAATDSLKNATTELCNKAISDLQAFKNAVNEIERAWMAVKDAIMAAIQMANQYAGMRSHYEQKPDPGLNIKPTLPDKKPGPSGGSGGSSGGGGSSGSSSGKGEWRYTVTIPLYDKSGGYIGDHSIPDVTRETEDAAIESYMNSHPNLYYKPGELAYSNNHYWKSFDTGGYTGSWGQEGKVAMLHEKELVLNKDDTENILKAVDIIRDITSLDNKMYQSVLLSLTNAVSQIAYENDAMGNNPITNNSVVNSNKDVQNIFQIEANFPNANDVQSIRQAILDLPNFASQYIAQNNK